MSDFVVKDEGDYVFDLEDACTSRVVHVVGADMPASSGVLTVLRHLVEKCTLLEDELARLKARG